MKRVNVAFAILPVLASSPVVYFGLSCGRDVSLTTSSQVFARGVPLAQGYRGCDRARGLNPLAAQFLPFGPYMEGRWPLLKGDVGIGVKPGLSLALENVIVDCFSVGFKYFG